MENTQAETAKKRKSEAMEMESNKSKEATSEDCERGAEDETEVNVPLSEEMEHAIASLHEKVNQFNQLVSDLLDTGKCIYNKLSSDFEDRILMIHREQIEKWQEEIKELKMFDSGNEEMSACLENAKRMFRGVDTYR